MTGIESASALNIPNVGTNIPSMGMSEGDTSRSDRRAAARTPSLADALFSTTQQRVLGLLFGQPERSFFASEIIGLLGAGSGAVQRELAKLAGSGLLTVTRVGNQKHYQANAAAPIYAELCSLVRKTVGIADPIKRALEPVLDSMDLALVYGSVAKGAATAGSDVDLLLVSDTLTLGEVFRLLTSVEQELARKVNPTLYSPEEFARRLSDRNPFLQRILSQDVLLLKGVIPDVG